MPHTLSNGRTTVRIRTAAPRDIHRETANRKPQLPVLEMNTHFLGFLGTRHQQEPILIDYGLQLRPIVKRNDRSRNFEDNSVGGSSTCANTACIWGAIRLYHDMTIDTLTTNGVRVGYSWLVKSSDT
jgi:hypothetical protein